MNIGDRVRLLHDNAEGIIRKFLKDGTVEVEIEDGFGIPVLPSDLVKVSTKESEYFGERQPKKEARKSTKKSTNTSKSIISEAGFYIAFDPINDQLLSVKLINNTDLDMLVTFGEFQDGGRHYGISGLMLRKRSVEKIHELSLAKFEKWGAFLVQALFFKAGYGQPKKSIARKLSFKANSFFKSKHTAPILDKEVYLYQIDGQHKPDPRQTPRKVEPKKKPENQKIDPEKIRESMFEGQKEDKLDRIRAKKEMASTIHEVDLHIEHLLAKNDPLPREEYLGKQITVFEQQLESAHMKGIGEIVFIHGVGNGVLRNEIHRRLSKSALVEYFKDARKEKFGYGATLVKMK